MFVLFLALIKVAKYFVNFIKHYCRTPNKCIRQSNYNRFRISLLYSSASYKLFIRTSNILICVFPSTPNILIGLFTSTPNTLIGLLISTPNILIELPIRTLNTLNISFNNKLHFIPH